MNPKLSDPVIDEIREIRHQISASCDHDPAKLVAYFQEFQKQFRDRLIPSPSRAERDHSLEKLMREISAKS